MSRDGWVALSRGAMGLSAVCDCGISWSYSLTIFKTKNLFTFQYFSFYEHVISCSIELSMKKVL